MRTGIVAIIAAAAMFGAPHDTYAAEAIYAPPVCVTVRAGDKTYTYTDKAIVPSDFTVAEEIAERRINAPFDEKIELVDECLRRGADFKTALTHCFPLLYRTVDRVKEDVYKPAVDAKVCYNGAFYVTDGEAGRALDENRLYAAIYYCLRSGGGSVNATTVSVKPNVGKAELERNLVKRGRYATDFSSSTPARAHNVKLAVKKFDGISLAAGATLSFNDTVGPRTEENGFKSAKIIVDGKYVDGVGGGACQASTAIYNASLRAGLSCRANAHTICPSYCPPGLDAMISSASDLLITNTTSHPVYFSVKTSAGGATVTVFGEPSEYEYVPESVVISTVERGCEEIVDSERKYFDGGVKGDRLLVSPGADGYASETYINKYKNGALVARYMIRSNVYKSVPRIIAINGIGKS